MKKGHWAKRLKRELAEATKPNGYCTKVFDCESMEDMAWVIERLREALDKPVLDADMFNSGG